MHIGSIPVGPVPLIVGVISTPAGLDRITAVERVDECDVVEVRLDRLLASGAKPASVMLSVARLPCPNVLTCRWAREGGAWNGDEGDRRAMLLEGLSVANAVDVEVNCGWAEEITDKASSAGKLVILSFHDFAGTPPEEDLRRVVTQMLTLGNVVPKLATMVNTAADLPKLEAVLAGEWPCPICVLGMGELGASARLDFAARGSCFIYGFLDQPSAPGQWTAAELSRSLARKLPAYARQLTRKR